MTKRERKYLNRRKLKDFDGIIPMVERSGMFYTYEISQEESDFRKKEYKKVIDYFAGLFSSKQEKED